MTDHKARLEEYAALIAYLEPDWNDLGPVRQINYAIRLDGSNFEPADGVRIESLISDIRAFSLEFDFELKVIEDDEYRGHATLSKFMPATARHITENEDLILSFANEAWRIELVGWHYPPRKSIIFWPKSRPFMHQLTSRDRASVLFDGAPAADPLITKNLYGESEFGRVARICRTPFAFDKISKHRKTSFNMAPSQFLRQAEAMSPINPEPTVSAFSQWVYTIYGTKFGDDLDKAAGKEAEHEIFLRRQAAAVNCNGNTFLRNNRPSWKLIHNGLHIPNGNHPNHFEIGALRVRGAPLRASPDLVYLNNATSQGIIVEIKHSRLPIPTNLWPNIWAQLWCYAHIDPLYQVEDLAVVGEIWGDTWSRGYGRGSARVDGERVICLRASVRRDPRAEAYDRFFRRLFEIYSGT